MKLPKVNNISGELAGSVGDLGTFLPYVIGAITIANLDVTSVLVMFGLMYLATAWFYRVPIPVQPMKVVGAAIIIHHLTAAEIAASGILIGVLLLIIAVTGLIEKLARITPTSVTIGIQTGLGISLAMLGMKMVSSDWLIGILILLIMLVLMKNRRFPASIVALVLGTALSFILHPELSRLSLHWAFNLPHPVLPGWNDFYRGFFQAALPQLPLTLTNSVLVTTFLASQLFPDTSERVSNKNLCLTLGIGNLLGAPLGMVPVCHGSGGLAAHHRFGARTGYSTFIIGLILLFIGLFLGSSGLQMLQIIPSAVLGGMLFYSGLDLIKPIKTEDNQELFIFAGVVVLSIALSPAIGFLAGVSTYFILKSLCS
ncbi:MAG: putative sulfate/molybdate transporter [Bacillota bacterium]|jgi:SulP family sulfate permease